MPKIPGVSLPRVFLVTAALIAIACGIALRASHTTDRPLHTDEAVQAWQTWQLLQGEGYRYDPVDMHGPTLYHGAAWWTRLTGGSAAAFDDFRARSFSVLAGALTLLLFWRWTSVNLGAGSALAVVALLAVMPLAVVYHTYFIHEPWLALASWALLFAAMHWWREPTFVTAIACGILAGLVQATKETSVVHFAAIAAALVALGWPRGSARQFTTHGVAALAAAAVVFVAFYSGFGTHPGGMIDGLLTYKHQFARAGDGAFEQPFFYYVGILFPHRTVGVWWGETGLLVCSVAGFVLALRRAAPAPVRAIAVFTLVLLLIYSAIPHKMPWLLLTPALGLATLAGFALSRLASFPRWGMFAAFAATLLVAGELGFRSERALGRFAGDVRNPYFLEQTPRGFTKLTDELARILAVEPNARIAVVSPNHAWPLPWYLRNRTSVGYFETPPVQPAAWDVRILDSQIEPPATWNDGAVVSIHGLRPNVVLTISVSEFLWTRVHP
jgi:uncharacterized protein (TIGR03663 family)